MRRVLGGVHDRHGGDMSNCPCGGVILADTENWKTPLCYACYTDLHEGYSAIVEKLRVAVEALESIKKNAQFAIDNSDDDDDPSLCAFALDIDLKNILAKIKGGGE